jgi:hypothetical protein
LKTKKTGGVGDAIRLRVSAALTRDFHTLWPFGEGVVQLSLALRRAMTSLQELSPEVHVRVLGFRVS